MENKTYHPHSIEAEQMRADRAAFEANKSRAEANKQAELDALRQQIEAYRSENHRYRSKLVEVQGERDRYERQYIDEKYHRLPGFVTFLITSIIWAMIAVFSHTIRSDIDGQNVATDTAKVQAEYLKTITPLSPSAGDPLSQCDAGKAFVGYRNGTGRALAMVDFEVRGYLPSRVANIVAPHDFPDAKDKPGQKEFPDARLDRIVQPGESFSECVKLDIADAYEGHAELSKATYKVKPVAFKFLEDFPGYVQDQAKN